jgi:hypothetical protein
VDEEAFHDVPVSAIETQALSQQYRTPAESRAAAGVPACRALPPAAVADKTVVSTNGFGGLPRPGCGEDHPVSSMYGSRFHRSQVWINQNVVNAMSRATS